VLAGDIATAEAKLDSLRASLQQAAPGSMAQRYLEALVQKLDFRLGYVTGDQVRATAAAEWFEHHGQHLRAALYYFLLHDPRAQRELELGRAEPPYLLLAWSFETAVVPVERRMEPLYTELEDLLGLNSEWRLEMCRRASRLPPETMISCDPGKYSVRE